MVRRLPALLGTPPEEDVRALGGRRGRDGIEKFAIGFDHRDRARLHALWDEIIDARAVVGGPVVEAFEAAWHRWNRLPAVAFNGWTGAALAALEFAGVRGETVLCPSNTFMATPLTAVAAGARSRSSTPTATTSACPSPTSSAKVHEHRPSAAFVVHIGGHIAFEIERIAELCAAEGIFLIEDCAHAHGADWNGRRAGTWGDAGIWSFAATKTISTGEGGMLVSRARGSGRVRAHLPQLRQAGLRGRRGSTSG